MANPWFNFEIRSKLLKDNRLLKFVTILLSVVIIFLVISLTRTVNKISIEILPSSRNEKIILNSGEINKAGAVLFARTAFDLLLNHTPKSAAIKFDEFLNLVHSDRYAYLKEELDSQLSAIKRLKIVSTFNIEDLRLNPKDDSIYAKGMRVRSSFGNNLGEKQFETEEWILKYKVCNFNFKIIEIRKDER